MPSIVMKKETHFAYVLVIVTKGIWNFSRRVGTHSGGMSVSCLTFGSFFILLCTFFLFFCASLSKERFMCV
ncbi:hypothetical protein F5Y12DRAFT_761635 [Xylaria sp. FL1777]|nr:hypothetical protein F5Y12DRAFT_761635 [Xylaria sp. FL1777]